MGRVFEWSDCYVVLMCGVRSDEMMEVMRLVREVGLEWIDE